MSVFDNYPEVSFINNATLEGTLKSCKEWYEKHHEELTGELVELADTDKIKLLLDTMAYMHWQKLCYIDQVGKINTLQEPFLITWGRMCRSHHALQEKRPM